MIDLLRQSSPMLVYAVEIALLAVLGRALPSRWLFMLMGLFACASLLGFWIPGLNSVLWMLSVILFVVLLLDWGITYGLIRLGALGVQIQRYIPGKLLQGETYQVELHCRALEKGIGQLVVEVVDQAPEALIQGFSTHRLCLSPGEAACLKYPLTPQIRGHFHFGRIHFRSRSLLGLLWLVSRTGRGEQVTVLPNMKRIQSIRLRYARLQRQGILKSRFQGLEGDDFLNLRPYVSGDESRKMDWRATARRDMPIVKQFSPELEQSILIVMDTSRRMGSITHGLSRLDWSVQAALGMVGVCLDRGEQVGCVTFDQSVGTVMRPATGEYQLQRMIQLLATIQQKPVEPDYDALSQCLVSQLKQNSVIVLFTDVMDTLTSRSLLYLLKQLALRHQVFLVSLKDSAVEQRAYDCSGDYQQAVALDLLAQRTQCLSRLKGSKGISIIDVPPEKLSQTLVEQYFSKV